MTHADEASRELAQASAPMLRCWRRRCCASTAGARRAARLSAGDAVDAGWILAKLARPAPMRTGFVELRGSALLKAPLRIEGEYRRPTRRHAGARSARAVRGDHHDPRRRSRRIARAGKSPRTFSLSRAPELAGLQASFGALLSGDRDAARTALPHRQPTARASAGR